MTREEARLWRVDHVSRRAWKRQLTCVTPWDRLPWFAGELVQLLGPFGGALLMVDETVFPADALEAFRRAAGEDRPIHEAPGHVFGADGDEFRRALQAALRDGPEFRVLFSPSGQALRGDHHGLITFFSMSPGRIASAKQALAGNVEIIAGCAAGDP